MRDLKHVLYVYLMGMLYVGVCVCVCVCVYELKHISQKN